MKHPTHSERLFLEEISREAEMIKKKSRDLPVGTWIKMVRMQLGMSQSILAKRARLPQSTISRVEKKRGNINLLTLNRILDALFCDFVVIPILREPIEQIRRKQARKQAERRIRYLKGTMNLEKQHPDEKFLKELMKQEENQFLQGPGSKLWENDEL